MKAYNVPKVVVLKLGAILFYSGIHCKRLKLYVETVSSIIFVISCLTVPTNISNLFIKANEKHNHETRFSSSCNFYINRSRLNQRHGSFAKFGAKLWNSICDELRQLPKRAFKKHINDMFFSLLEAEDDYVESPILLQKIATYRTNTEYTYLNLVSQLILRVSSS